MDAGRRGSSPERAREEFAALDVLVDHQDVAD